MAGTGKRVLKYGCFGCFGVIAMVAVFGVVVFGIAWSGAQSEEIEERRIAQDLPVREAPDSTVTAPQLPAENVAQNLEAPPFEADPAVVAAVVPQPPATHGPAAPSTHSPHTPRRVAAGRVVLDLANADFVIEPGRPGEPIQVEARYDRNSYELEEELDPDGAGEGVFLSRISFRRTGGSGFIAAVRELIAGSSPRVEIRLPPDVPIDLDIKLRQGGAEVELGGLWLVSSEIDYKQGGLVLEISRPLRQPMELLSISGSMGGGTLDGLGNASPKVLEIDYSMGGMAADLQGEWRCDSQVRVHGSMGGGALMLPRDVTVVGAPGAGLREPAREELPGPTIHLDVSSEMGELEVVPR